VAPSGEKLTDPANKAAAVEASLTRAKNAPQVIKVIDPYHAGMLTADKRIAFADVIYPAPKEEGFLYLGRSHRLQILETEANRVRLDGGRLVLPAALRQDGQAAVIRWYQDRGEGWLGSRLGEGASTPATLCDHADVRARCR